MQHHIDTQQEHPIRTAPYRRSPQEQEIIKAEIDTMLRDGIIQRSTSPWASPVVLVTKKDGSVRFCVDFRKLNEATVKDTYPLPRIDDTLDALHGARYFTTLDLAAGYWQIKMEEESRAKTAFVSKHGLYEFNVLPFGLCNAPATFQRLMDTVLAGLTWKECLVYLDDILVFSKTFEEHLVNLANVFDRLRTGCLKIKASKCQFLEPSVDYLGHVISVDGIRPNPKKIASVKAFAHPKTKKDIMAFLGLCGYYRRFIPDMATIAAPMCRLLQKTVDWQWDEECEYSFQALKKRLVSSPVLRSPDFARQFTIYTDASNYGWGAVLAQHDDEGGEYVIQYASRSFTAPQRNYQTTEKECLAVIEAIKAFRPYLHGREFVIVTDHAALRQLLGTKEATGRISRWIMHLQQYTFVVQHRAGNKHLNADAISRDPSLLPVPSHTHSQEVNAVNIVPALKSHVLPRSVPGANIRCPCCDDCFEDEDNCRLHFSISHPAHYHRTEWLSVWPPGAQTDPAKQKSTPRKRARSLTPEVNGR